jgi:uncharacterized membrane protein
MASSDSDFPAAAPERRHAAGRIEALDVARGVALGAMALYHATWDLGYLRLTPENYALAPVGKVAAHGIAGSFLVLVGIGLVLAHGAGIRWRGVLTRVLRIGGAALAVTVSTYALFPESYVFFGILHCIAVSSLLALPFLFVPVAPVAVCAIAVIASPVLVGGEFLDAPALFFLGLGRTLPQTNDYVPLFPWFGMVLGGIVAGRLGLPRLRALGLGRWRTMSRPGRVAAFAGRHSLAVYLVHQPVLLALFSGIAALAGPHPRAGEAEFRALYARNCVGTGGEAVACRVAARCVVGAFRRDGLWAQSQRTFTVAERTRAQTLSQACYEAAEGTTPAP